MQNECIITNMTIQSSPSKLQRNYAAAITYIPFDTCVPLIAIAPTTHGTHSYHVDATYLPQRGTVPLSMAVPGAPFQTATPYLLYSYHTRCIA